MSAPEKAEVVTKVSSSPLPKRKVLRELGIPKSTYYRWLRRQDQQGLEDRPGGDQPPWNRLTIQEECSVLLSARGDARAELPSAGRVDHRQPGLLSLRVQRLPYPGQGGPSRLRKKGVSVNTAL